ncbi:glycoside hydrolase family 16 protein [Lentisphaera marina]|uniref:glycoside hydrolase family 16 protein n=1 Tax=Lentisphaera marina TaxID=1111041 RepID=UPI0023667CB5|nr:glycoside hydrolase family 16 protein [Lentisphaera marina]MDD7986028.1 glycoside hydrolase family 16 protein [Lentisphaera marina]
MNKFLVMAIASLALFANAADSKVTGVHYFSEKPTTINKHCGNEKHSDSSCFAWKPKGQWKQSAKLDIVNDDKVEGKYSYKFTLNHGWSRWVLEMKKGKSVDYSAYDRLVFYVKSADAKYWDSFKVIIESSKKWYAKELSELGFKPNNLWQRIEIPVADLAKAGVDTKNITKLLQFSWGGGVAGGHEFYLDNVCLEKGPRQLYDIPEPKVWTPDMVKSNPFADMSGYELVWADEFNVDGPPNPDNWKFEEGFSRNRELQWYQKDNAVCKDGMLVIEARKEVKPNPTFKRGGDWRQQRKNIEYTSSSIVTNGLHSWKYGRFEIRAKVDAKSGTWPAIWTVGDIGQWPSSGEIDLMEYYKGKILANTVWGTRKRWHGEWNAAKKSLNSFGQGWEDHFHVWRMDWDENYIKIYVDDVLLNKTDLSKTINPMNWGPKNPFQSEHHFILNMALGGDNGGTPIEKEFPAHFIVDYVRIYQKK